MSAARKADAKDLNSSLYAQTVRSTRFAKGHVVAGSDAAAALLAGDIAGFSRLMGADEGRDP